MIPTSSHNEALSGDTLYSAFLNYEWRQIVIPYIVRGMEEIARTITDESDRQDFEALYGAMIDDFYNEDIVDGTPVGAVMWFPVVASKLPEKWLICDGTSYSRTTYPDLFNAIRDNYPFTSTTFEVPNLTARFLYGAGNDAQLADVGGNAVHTLDISEIPGHTHVQNARNSPAGASTTTAAGVNVSNTAPVATITSTGSAGGGGSHNNMPPYERGYWMIKALP